MTDLVAVNSTSSFVEETRLMYYTYLRRKSITPVLKKHGLDSSSLSSYRPISNLSFLSKILEKVVAFQLQAYLTAHSLYQPFQSGFHPLHST